MPRAVSAFIALPSRSTCASTSCRPLEEAIWAHAAEMVSSCLPTARACGSSVTVVRKEARRAWLALGLGLGLGLALGLGLGLRLGLGRGLGFEGGEARLTARHRAQPPLEGLTLGVG